MSFKSDLEIEGTKFKVLHCNYSLRQEFDETGRPSTTVRGGTITVTIDSSESADFFTWMADPYKMKNGKVIFYKRDEKDAVLKELAFEDGYLVEYQENFDHKGDNPTTETFKISAKKITMGDGEHANEWV